MLHMVSVHSRFLQLAEEVERGTDASNGELLKLLLREISLMEMQVGAEVG